MAFFANQIYTIANRKQDNGNNMFLALFEANSANATPCQVHNQSNTEEAFNQQWLVKTVPGKCDIYTFQNIRTGTYLDLRDGSKNNGALVVGWQLLPGTEWESAQQWRIIPNGNYTKIQNVASGTYLDLLNGSSAPDTQVHGWEWSATETQDWSLRRVSRTDVELRGIIAKDTHNAPDFQGFSQDGLYLVLPQSVRDAIYVSSRLKTMKGRGQLFDSDDYAIVLKAEVAKWGIANLLADDFGLLWGLMFSRNDDGALAYNFYLNEDLDTVVFFDPYTGEEKADMGYKAYMALY
ncbi:hypothetical protein JR316_0009439 [Psilocybe cubensis]|uniref:Ricin B lectin domain-containing protein n=2 Tax=Psilocybe cubensis TaxID=181762 RepID=A0A8H7XZP0_PSICU|nr:hypothetical protein JR316_0009439 [Psilocybe cubensis]KAH9478976.1 hypothetical protein JR316_0009439 [Psilocybe cubensis]